MRFFSHNAALGFWLRDTELEAAVIWPKKKGWKLAGQTKAGSGGLLTAVDRRERLRQAFCQCVKKLPRVARRADLGAVLALPEQCIEEEVLSFSEFPSSDKEAQALVAHRMARELGTSVETVTVSWDVFRSEAVTVCRVRALDKGLRADIEAAAADAGLRLTRIDGWAGISSGAPEFGELADGAAVWSDGAEWSLLCWSRNDPYGFLQHGDCGPQMAEDVVRMSRSYALSQSLDSLDLVMDLPNEQSNEVSVKAGSIGLTLRRFAADTSRAERVAAWG